MRVYVVESAYVCVCALVCALVCVHVCKAVWLNTACIWWQPRQLGKGGKKSKLQGFNKKNAVHTTLTATRVCLRTSDMMAVPWV
jgi:hypothetical protein